MTTPSFLGIPVEGDLVYGSERKNQRPIEELAPLIQALLDDPTIDEFGWKQYTPYFNDGDPCVFGAHSVWVRTDQDDPENDDEWGEDLLVDYHQTLGKRNYHWEDRQRIDDGYEGPDEERFNRCQALDKAIESEEFDDVLLAAFGDHAEVTVTRTGITVEFYEHD